MKLFQLAGTISALAIAGALAFGTATESNAALITQFNKTTNDGVFTLTGPQISLLGEPSATHIGFFRVREGSGTTFADGDTFDVTTMSNSVTSGGSSIIKFLNGENTDLTYTGSFFDELGTTTVGVANSYFRGVAFLFSGTGNIVFRGSSTFNAGQTSGEFTGLAPIPLPAAGWLLLSALGGLGLVARRRRKAA